MINDLHRKTNKIEFAKDKKITTIVSLTFFYVALFFIYYFFSSFSFINYIKAIIMTFPGKVTRFNSKEYI